MRPSRLVLDPKGFYACLGIDASAPQEAVVAAFRRKARVLHPDIAGRGNPGAFVEVKLAYDVLGNRERRAAYDRAARLAAPESLEGDDTRPPTSRPTRVYSRQPRVSDLPLTVWGGMVAVLCFGIVEIVRHLTEPAPARQVEIRPNAPIVVPASPAQSRALAFGPEPLRLAGLPNHYVVPTASPTILWRDDPQRNALAPVGQLPPFSSLQALRLFRLTGLVEVRVTDTSIGYVEATRLAPGDVTVARRAYCAFNAGPSPLDGEVLERHGSGPGHLMLDNRLAQPVVIKLRDVTGKVALAVFLAPSGHAQLDGLPDERFRPEYAIGEFWSQACRTFSAGMRAQRLPGYFSLTALTPLAVPPDLPGEAPVIDIPDQAFDRE
jgi:curved DNA-binding protein CbpA